ncbi:MAG: hypothetical protein [Circular genetic element sp.]|nr:MAG: hypothetical protein [Circular genetic element sp.]
MYVTVYLRLMTLLSLMALMTLMTLMSFHNAMLDIKLTVLHGGGTPHASPPRRLRRASQPSSSSGQPASQPSSERDGVYNNVFVSIMG